MNDVTRKIRKIELARKDKILNFINTDLGRA